MKRLLSFLSLFIIGWGCAWGQTYPKTWDFTTSNNTDGLTITNTGTAANWVYVEGVGFTGQRGGNEAIITIPNVMYGNVITVDLSTGGSDPNNNNRTKYWEISCNGETLASGNGGAVGTKTVSIPNTVTSLTNATISIRGYSDASWLVLSRIEVTRSTINWTNDGKSVVNNVNYADDLKKGYAVIPFDGSNFWVLTSRQQITDANGRAINIAELCDGTETNWLNYFSYSVSPNILDVTTFDIQNANNDTERRPRFKVKPKGNGFGTAILTLTYAGNNAWEPFTKTYNITVKGDYSSVPRIIWVTSWNDHITAATNSKGVVTASEAGTNPSTQIPGNIYTRRYLKPNTGSEPTNTVVTYHTDNILIGYNDKADFHAIPLRAGVTNEMLEQAGLVRVPYIDGMDEHWAIYGQTGQPESTQIDRNYWRTYLLGDYLFASPSGRNVSSAYAGFSYEISPNASDWTRVTNTASDNNNIGGQGAKSYNIYVESVPEDSVGVTAKLQYDGGTVTSTTFFKVYKKKFNMSFVPKEGQVAENRWIMPYLKFPDLKLSDFKKVWVTIDDGTVVNVSDAASLYDDEWGKTGDVTNIPEWITWKWSDYKKDGQGNNIPGTQYPIITGIRPQVWGIAGKAGETTTITIHVDSPVYYDTEATWKVTVVGEEQMAFHFEMNDDDETTSDAIKTITMVEGDFIYMPGIIGNPNGNAHYSRSHDQHNKAGANGSFTYPGLGIDYEGQNFRPYAYSIKYYSDTNTKTVEMNWDPYFYGEGVADYFFTGSWTPNAVPVKENGKWKPDAGGFFRMIPGGGYNTPVSNVVYPTIIFKEVGLGNYYRNDSLMIYALHATNDLPCYLWAQDAQSGYACKPIRIKVVPRTIVNESASSEWTDQSLEKQKMEAMRGMTYPFTWDFEHMDLSDLAAIEQDATNGGNGNGGTYWRARWDADPNKGETVLRTPKSIERNYYQYNGGFNADHDDKDSNGYLEVNQIDEISGVDEFGNPVIEKRKVSGMRQRWFKDITANGKYLNMFKGLMLNIAGLDYWQQKYTRFNVSKNPNGGIHFEGNTHYLSLPGFGICGSNNKIGDATRTMGYISMPGPDGSSGATNIKDHVQFNTNDNVTNISDFQTGKTVGSNAVTYTSNIAEAKKNKKVKFVIKASGSNGSIYIGGKSMMLNTNQRNKAPRNWDTSNAYPGIYNGNGTEIGENGTKFDGRNMSTSNNPDIAMIKTKNKADVYVVELNPWDEDLQDQIYLALRDVTIYWMGITTEPRNMRSDYEVFTYSYPKDIDMEKTNQVMGILTQKVEDQETGEKGIQFEARYASEYKRNGQLVATKIPGYKFGAYEGVFIYPNKQLNKMTNFKASNYGNPTNRNYTGTKDEDLTRLADVSDVTVTNNKVIQIALNSDGKARIDQNGNYIYQEVSQNHTYSYLPVYFVANAENMPTYENNAAHGNRGRELRMDMDGIVANTGVDNGSAPLVGNDNVDYNARTNKLKGQPYSRWIPQDYYSNTDSITVTGGNTNGNENGSYRWIPLTMTNKFMLRYLTNDTEGNRKALGDLVKDTEGKFVNGGSDIYYKLIGPEVVRFYRTFVANYPKGRRAHIVLTWHEYNVDTNGKSGISNGHENEFPWEDPEKENPTTEGPNPDSPGGNPPVNVKIVFAERINNEDEDLVSEDGGFPDGIEEIEQIEEDAKIYNLNGVRVTSPNKGIYIYNGKKVIIK